MENPLKRNKSNRRPGQPSWDLDPAVANLLEPRNREALGRAPIVMEAEDIAHQAFRKWVYGADISGVGRANGIINSPSANLRSSERSAVLRRANIAMSALAGQSGEFLDGLVSE